MTDMTNAQAAQQNNRDGAGKYKTKAVGESGAEIETGYVPMTRFKALKVPDDLNATQRLKWIGSALESRDILCEAGTEAQLKFGNDAHALEYVEDDGVFSRFSVHSAPDANGEARELGTLEAEGVFYDNGAEDVKISDEAFSVAKCAELNTENDGEYLMRVLARDHMRATTFDYVGMGPGDMDWAIEGLAGSEGFEDIEDINSLSDEQYAALVESMSRYEIPKSAFERMTADFSEEVSEKLAEILQDTK